MREPNLTLTLEALASSGLVLPAEQKASLENALLLKKAESGLANIAFVGKITTVNGKDYMISQAWGKGTILNKEVELESKLFYSQDGTKWADLPPVGDAEDTERVMRLRNPLTGDPALISTVEEAAPVPEKEEVEGEEEAAEEEEPPEPLKFDFTELQRLSALVDALVTSVGIIAPKGSSVVTALNDLTKNVMFSGLSYPDKLESFHNTLKGPEGPSLADDVRGVWSLQFDGFKQLTVVRSLLWPGFAYYYSGSSGTWGQLYMGNGMKNTDLVFML